MMFEKSKADVGEAKEGSPKEEAKDNKQMNCPSCGQSNTAKAQGMDAHKCKSCGGVFDGKGHTLSAKTRSALPKDAFAVPSKAPGSGSYPMPDKLHARVAMGLAAMHNDSHKAAIDAKAKAILKK